jgi:hypothetical protein
MRDPELVARAQHAAARLESAWEQWRALHGLADAPGQPVVSYVGYSLKEPWGEPRVVIGIDADEAEYLAEFLDRDECVPRGQVPLQQSAGQQSAGQQAAVPQVPAAPQVTVSQAVLPPGPLQPGPLQPGQLQSAQFQSGQFQPGQFQPGQLQSVPLQAGPLQSGPLQQVARTEPAAEGTGEYPALFSPPSASSRSRQAPDQGRDIAAELVGWNQAELPGQLPEQFASWPPGAPSADQPPSSA